MPRHAVLLLSLLTLLAVARGGARAEDEPSRAFDGTTRIPLAHPVPDETNWYGLYKDGIKVGYGRLGLTLEGEGEHAVYRSRSRFRAEFFHLGVENVFRTDSTDVFRGRAPFDLLVSYEMRRQNDLFRTITVRKQGRRYVATLREDGESRERDLGVVDYTLADRLTHLEWTRAGPAVGARIRVRELNLYELVTDVYTYQVVGTRTARAWGVPVRLYDITMHRDRSGPLGTALLDSQGVLMEGPLARVLEMRNESRNQAIELILGSEVFAYGHAAVDQRLGDPRRVETLVLAAVGDVPEEIPTGPRQAVEPTDGGALLRLGEGWGRDRVAAGEDLEPFRRASALHPIDRGDLRAVAARAAGAAEGDEAVVRALVAWVSEYLTDALVSEWPSWEVLFAEPVGDASEHARLFVALARARGLAAREVTGLAYLGDEGGVFAPHGWAEVVIDGRWVPVDPTWNEVPADATHIALGRDDENPALTRWRIGDLELEVRAVVRSE